MARGKLLPRELGHQREVDSRVKFLLVTKQGWKQWVGFTSCYAQWPAALMKFIMDSPWEGADEVFVHLHAHLGLLRGMRATYLATGSDDVWKRYWLGFCQRRPWSPLYRQPCLEWWELVRAGRTWLCVPRAQFYARGGFERRVEPTLSLK